MSEFKPDWEDRLSGKPFQPSNFTERQMKNVEKSIREAEGKRRRANRARIAWMSGLGALAIAAVVLLTSVIDLNLSKKQSEPLPKSGNEHNNSSAKIEDKTNVSFENFEIPANLIPIRMLEDSKTNPDVSYKLFEYAVEGKLTDVDKWIRGEAARLNGQLSEQSSNSLLYDRVDLFIRLPVVKGSRLITTFTPNVGGEQRLVVIETESAMNVVPEEHSHGLVVVTPKLNGTTKETFLANYEHEHTDVYSIYFYSQAFLKQLRDDGYPMLRHNLKAGMPKFKVGYFDSDGNEFTDEVNQSNLNRVRFGIQLNEDFLPGRDDQRELVLESWARTALLGNKTRSGVTESNKGLYFLQGKQVIAFYSIDQLLTNR